jgi:hypothetical protein
VYNGVIVEYLYNSVIFKAASTNPKTRKANQATNTKSQANPGVLFQK